MGRLYVSRNIKNNAYPKFWGQTKCIMGKWKMQISILGLDLFLCTLKVTLLFLKVCLENVGHKLNLPISSADNVWFIAGIDLLMADLKNSSTI